MRHGEPQEVVPPEIFLGHDRDLALVVADMDVWLDAHPCGADDDEVCHNETCHCDAGASS